MPLSTTLKFSPYVWSKLLFWANAFDHEISGMGISHHADPMTIVDLVIIKQKSSVALTTFDPAAYADFVMEYCDPDGKHKMKPAQCQRHWVHVHPQGVAGPSSTDESTFAEAFGSCDWSTMLILPKGGELFARMHLNVGPDRLDVPLKHAIAWHLPFQAADHAAWADEVSKFVEVSAPYQPIVHYGATAPGMRTVPLPTTPKGPTNRAPAPQTRAVVPFSRDTAKVITNQKGKNLSKRERRVARRKDALDDLKQELNTDKSISLTIRMYSNSERLRVPRMTPQSIKELEEAGFQAVYMGDSSIHFKVPLQDGKWENVTYEDAYLYREDCNQALDELAGVEHALVHQTGAKTRKLNDKVRFATYTTEWEEPAEHKYVLRAIDIEGANEVFLTDTEMEAVNSVFSGKLTADEALMALPDYSDVDQAKAQSETQAITKPAPGTPEDSKLTEKAMDMLAGGPEVLILESDN